MLWVLEVDAQHLFEFERSTRVLTPLPSRTLPLLDSLESLQCRVRAVLVEAAELFRSEPAHVERILHRCGAQESNAKQLISIRLVARDKHLCHLWPGAVQSSQPLAEMRDGWQ